MRGGKRPGAGRKLGTYGPREQRSFNLSKRALAFVAMFALRLNVSENEALERIVRAHLLFVSEEEASN